MYTNDDGYTPLTTYPSGGGNATNLKLNRFGPPLRWMLYEAMDSGLLVKPFKIGAWKAAEHHPSMTWVWKVLECLPLTRLSYDADPDERTIRWYASLNEYIMVAFSH